MNKLSTRKNSIKSTSSPQSELANHVAAPQRGDVLICYDEVFSAQNHIHEARRQMSRRHLYLLGRVLLSSIFIISAIGKLTDWSGNAQTMADKGLPVVPYFLGAALAIELLGGLALLFGFRTRWIAGLLFFYLIPVTLIMHNFWAARGGEAQMQLIHFLKNLAIMGGLLTVAASADENVIMTSAPVEDEREEMPVSSKAARARREEHVLHH